MKLLRSALPVLAALALLSGCAASPPMPLSPGHTADTELAPNATTTAAPTNGEGTAAGVRYVERVTGGAQPNDPLVMVVVLHGRGGDASQYIARFVDGFPERARFVALYGVEPAGRGFQWWDKTRDHGELAERVDPVEAKVTAAVNELRRVRPTVDRPIVAGLSQGGILTFGLAVRHPDVFREAFAMSGEYPAARVPPRIDPAAVPPIHAFSGAKDAVVPADRGKETVDALKKVGWPAEIAIDPVGGHIPSESVMATVREQLAAAIRKAAQKPGS